MLRRASLSSVSIDAGQAEEECDADQNQEKSCWKAGRHIGDFHSTEKHSNDERKGDAQHSDIDFGNTANDDRHRECDDGKYG